MKKVIIGILGLIAAASLYGAKKIDTLINISNKLTFKLVGFPSVNISSKTVKVSVKIINPTAYDLQAKFVKIKNIRLSLPGKTPFANSTTEISNISIPANSDFIIRNIVFKVHISLLQVFRLIRDFNNIEVTADVSAFGQSVKVTN